MLTSFEQALINIVLEQREKINELEKILTDLAFQEKKSNKCPCGLENCADSNKKTEKSWMTGEEIK